MTSLLIVVAVLLVGQLVTVAVQVLVLRALADQVVGLTQLTRAVNEAVADMNADGERIDQSGAGGD